MKIQKLKQPSMVKGTISAKIKDDDDMPMSKNESVKAIDQLQDRKKEIEDVIKAGPKPMAKGGEAASETEVKPDRGFGKIIIIGKDGQTMAEGGMIDESEMEDEKHASIAAAIMARKERAK